MLDPMRASFTIMFLMIFAVLAQAKADSLQDFSRDLDRSNVPISVKTVLSGDSVLDDGGTVYKLVGIDIPETMVDDAAAYLTELAKGQKCTLYQTKKTDTGRVNRMGQTLGHLECSADNIWLQGNLLARGFARVRTTPANPELTDVMLKIEQMARSKKRGLWAQTSYGVLTPEQATKKTDGFHVVEGTVYATAQTREMFFINFAQDWKNDFSIGIPLPLLREFSQAHIPLQSLKGKPVRVRGWVRDYNGPFIEIDHITQLEILDKLDAPAPDTADKNVREGEAPATPSENAPTAMHTIKRPAPPVAPELPPVKPTPSGDKEE